MKRYLPLLLSFFCCLTIVGCPGGGDDGADEGGDTAATDGTRPGDGAAMSGGFKEGVGSGRAEDGSDEGK